MTNVKIDGHDPKAISLGYKLWDSNDLPGINPEYVSRGYSAALYWPVNKRYRISGNYRYCSIEKKIIS